MGSPGLGWKKDVLGKSLVTATSLPLRPLLLGDATPVRLHSGLPVREALLLSPPQEPGLPVPSLLCATAAATLSCPSHRAQGLRLVLPCAWPGTVTALHGHLDPRLADATGPRTARGGTLTPGD